MAVDMRLVRKGKSEPREGLIKQGKVHVALGRQYAEALIESGWSSEDTAELEKNVSLLEVMKVPETLAQQEDSDASDPESTAIGEAKVFIRRLRNALPRALRETTATGVAANEFEAGERFGRSAEKISSYLTRIRPMVESLDGDLKKHFGGKKASEMLDKVKSSLGSVGTATDESAHAGESEEALAFYELKGRALEGIEDLNRAGRIAFEGQGEVVGKFNKDILLRARRERSGRDSKQGDGSPSKEAGSEG